MTQHVFSATVESGEKCHVLTGWDRPLQQYFLVIEADTQLNDDDEGIIYSNLYDSGMQSHDWEYYAGILDKHAITIPDGLELALQNDRLHNVGNAITSWDSEASQVICEDCGETDAQEIACRHTDEEDHKMALRTLCKSCQDDYSTSS